jgi:uncharacterized protein
MEFAPFENRLCRDIRNHLANGFLEALQNGAMEPVNRTILTLKQQKLAPFHLAYIDNRRARYQTILAHIKFNSADPFTTAVLLWDQALFFECHEWLEPFWMQSEGKEKKLIQALIRSAGTFALLEARRNTGAKKTADKALAFLTANTAIIPDVFAPARLISALKSLESPPPRLMSS